MEARAPDDVALIDFTFVYDDGRVVVVDKPPRLPSTGRDRDDPRSLEHLLARRLGRRVWAVHQLDADTSGVIVFVTRKSLVAPWAQRLAQHGEKTYLAICHGTPDFDETLVDAPIAPTGRRGVPSWRIARPGDEGARSARSRVRVRDVAAGHALLEVTLLTGRTHQARLHVAHLGLPLVGERIYRTPPSDEHPRHALHAHALTFDDGREPARLVAPLAPDLRELAARLGLRVPESAVARA
ncbi:MAG TPA: RNA pseudouridine synthase [Candidatus Binatia bacterium]